MSSPSLYAVGAGARTRRHAHRSDGLYRSALSSAAARRGNRDRRSDARRAARARSRSRHQSGLFPAVRPRLRATQIADAGIRRLPARGLSARRSRFRFTAKRSTPISAELAVQPLQRPHPPLWMMTRDPRRSNSAPRTASIPDISWSIRAPTRRRAIANSSRLAAGRLGQQAEHRLLHGRLCRRDRPEGARCRAVSRQPRL